MAEIRDGMRDAAVRAAHALIHATGGTKAALRLPLLPVSGDDGEELGLRGPQFQDRPVFPVAVKRSGGIEVLVPADVMEDLLGVAGAVAVRQALASAAAVVVGDAAHVLDAVEEVGSPCLYRLRLRPTDEEEG